MTHLTLRFEFNEQRGLKSVEWHENTTGLEETTGTLQGLAICLLESISKNKDSLKVQDLLNELGIPRASEEE